jgi:hypothetical protein
MTTISDTDRKAIDLALDWLEIPLDADDLRVNIEHARRSGQDRQTWLETLPGPLRGIAEHWLSPQGAAAIAALFDELWPA